MEKYLAMTEKAYDAIMGKLVSRIVAVKRELKDYLISFSLELGDVDSVRIVVNKMYEKSCVVTFCVELCGEYVLPIERFNAVHTFLDELERDYRKSHPISSNLLGGNTDLDK